MKVIILLLFIVLLLLSIMGLAGAMILLYDEVSDVIEKRRRQHDKGRRRL